MHVIRRKGWEIPERLATPELVYLNRRQILAASGLGFAATLLPGAAFAESDPSAGLYPAPRNTKYTIDRPVTPEEVNTHYNNFYEFGTQKSIAAAAEALPIRPWDIRIDGMVEAETTLAIDDLLKKVPARGTALSSPLRRGLVDDGAVDRVSRSLRSSRWRSRSAARNICASRPS